MDWVTIDFEASCLPRHGRSFPIEVGISGALGTCSWLIRPLPEWQAWDWTESAQRIHGIPREQLEDEGLAPATVLREVLEAVGAARVVADSRIDRLWWQTLLDAAGPAVCPRTSGRNIGIEHVADLFDELGATHAQILFAQQRADGLCPERHRAGTDARWLFTLLSTLTQRIDDDRATTPLFSPGWAAPSPSARGIWLPQMADC